MNEHEGPAMHHKKENIISPEIILAISILLGAVILGYSMMTAANAIGTGIQGLTLQGTGNPSLIPTPTPDPSLGNNPPAPTAQMSDLIQNGAGTLGNENAPITIVEFSDYQCPFCRAWFKDTKGQLQTNYIDTGKVKLVYKDFPLSFHPMAQPYAEAARCAGDQSKYWEMHDKIFNEQSTKGQGTVQDFTATDIKKWATDLGLDATAFNNCLDTAKYASAVQANFTEGQQIGVSGTPAFFIGKSDGTGQLVVGAQPYTVFQQAIDSLLE